MKERWCLSWVSAPHSTLRVCGTLRSVFLVRSASFKLPQRRDVIARNSADAICVGTPALPTGRAFVAVVENVKIRHSYVWERVRGKFERSGDHLSPRHVCCCVFLVFLLASFFFFIFYIFCLPAHVESELFLWRHEECFLRWWACWRYQNNINEQRKTWMTQCVLLDRAPWWWKGYLKEKILKLCKFNGIYFTKACSSDSG